MAQDAGDLKFVSDASRFLIRFSNIWYSAVSRLGLHELVVSGELLLLFDCTMTSFAACRGGTSEPETREGARESYVQRAIHYNRMRKHQLREGPAAQPSWMDNGRMYTTLLLHVTCI